MRRAAQTLFCIASALLVVSCGGSVPRTHYYLLEAANVPRPAGGADADSRGLQRIGARPFAVDPPYDQDRIVYRVGEDSAEVGFYAYHRWAVPLSRMLPVVAAGILGQADVSHDVEPIRSDRVYDAYLEGRLFRLEEVDTSGGARVRARLELILRDASGDVVWSRVAAAESTVRTDDVEVVVREMRSVLEQALRRAAAPEAAQR